jgi:hypothetical protein
MASPPPSPPLNHHPSTNSITMPNPCTIQITSAPAQKRSKHGSRPWNWEENKGKEEQLHRGCKPTPHPCRASTPRPLAQSGPCRHQSCQPTVSKPWNPAPLITAHDLHLQIMKFNSNNWNPKSPKEATRANNHLQTPSKLSTPCPLPVDAIVLTTSPCRHQSHQPRRPTSPSPLFDLQPKTTGQESKNWTEKRKTHKAQPWVSFSLSNCSAAVK